MRKKILLIPKSMGMIWMLFILFFVNNSCEKASPLDCFKNTGSDITELRSSGPIKKIILNDNVNLVLTQNESTAISIHGGKNVLKKVKTDINDSILNIENQNSCNWMRSFDREITVYVDVNQLHEIEYRGSGDISCSNTIVTDSLLLNVWEGAGKVEMKIETPRSYLYFHIGTADIFYSGIAQLSYITASSFGPIYAQEMESDFTYIANEGSNDCYVFANTRVEATIRNLGNIYYKGTSDILLNNTGQGELIKME